MRVQFGWLWRSVVIVVISMSFVTVYANAAEEKINIRAATNVASSDLMSRTMEHFLQVLEAKGKGKISYNMFSGGVLGTTPQVHESMKMNAIQMFSGTVGDLAPYDPICDISNFPYLYKSAAHGNRVWEKIGPEFYDGVAKRSGWRILYTWVGAPRDLTAKKSITRPEELAGLKIRVPNWPIFIKMFKDYYKAAPTVISFGELYMALKTGVVDAQENPVYRNIASGFYEVTPYNIRTHHVYDLNDVHVSEKFWKSLSPAMQKIFMEAIAETRSWTVAESERLIASSEAEAKAKFRAIFVDPDIEAFRKAVAGIENDYPVLKDLVLKIRTIQ
jgi:tripartite ATP-independent transporter DctP family solute receptor